MATLDRRHRAHGRRRRRRRHGDLAGDRAARRAGRRPAAGPACPSPRCGARTRRRSTRRRSPCGTARRRWTTTPSPSASARCRSTRERGLRINGEPVKLRGACVHSDNGVLGAADDRPRRRAPGRAAQGGRVQRAAQRAQPDEPGDARRLRPARRARHGRADRHVDREQVRLRRRARLPGVVGARRRGDGRARTSTTRASSSTRSATRSRRSARPHGAVWSRRLAEKVRSLDGTRFVTNGINAMLAVIGEAATPEAARGGHQHDAHRHGRVHGRAQPRPSWSRRGRRSPTTCSTSPA